MGMLSRFLGRNRPVRVDAQKIYARLMSRSRDPVFYGEEKFPDTYEGRIELLTFHMACMMKALGVKGEQGQRLSQALFDEMVDDFDIALRDEGLTDSGVKRRIKPIVRLFYARLKAFSESSTVNALSESLKQGELKDSTAVFASKIAQYGLLFDEALTQKEIGALARGDFEFPSLEL